MPRRLMHCQSRSGSGRDSIMAITPLGVTVLTLLAGCVVEASFRFSYDPPGGGTVSQYYYGPTRDLAYQYGFDTPSQRRSEKKNYDGRVEGDYAYTDANGELIRVAYDAAPGLGFRTREQAAVERSAAVSNVIPGQSTLGGPTFKSGITSDPDFAANYPQLLEGVRSGYLVPVELAGQQAFRVVEPVNAESQRSHSALADRFGVDLFAPRHDQQTRSFPGSVRTFQSDDSNKAVLLPAEQPDGSTIIFITLPSSRI